MPPQKHRAASAGESSVLIDDLEEIKNNFDQHKNPNSEAVELMHNNMKRNIECWLPDDLTEVLLQFRENRRVITPQSYIALISYSMVFEHLDTRRNLINSGKDSVMTAEGKLVHVYCGDLKSQCPHVYNKNDNVLLITHGGIQVMAKYDCEFGSAVLFNIKERDQQLLHGQKLKCLINMTNDAQTVAVLEKIRQFTIPHIEYIFPKGIKVRPIVGRSQWKFDIQDIQTVLPKHAKFVKNICTLHYHGIFLSIGIAGSGKRLGLVRVITTMLQNDKKCKITLVSGNNMAIDVLLAKVKQRVPKAKITRFASKALTRDMKGILDPTMYTDDMEIAKQRYETSNVFALTAAKCSAFAKPKTHSNLVILEEGSLSPEYDALALFYTFGNLELTNFIICGDTAQLPFLSRSWNAQQLGICASTMDRLTKAHSNIYDVSNPDPKSTAPYVIYNQNLRCPMQIIEHCKGFYPYPIFSQKEHLQDKIYWNIKNIPEGPIIYHDVTGRQNYYTNGNCSISNAAEMQVIIKYLKIMVKDNKIPASDILVQSFYSKQLIEGIVEARRAGIKADKCLTGDAVIFAGPKCVQGIQKRISFISLTQAGKRSIGEFLEDPRQANVAISRITSLLIIVGDSRIVTQSEFWNTFMQYKLNPKDIGSKYLKK